MKTIPVISALLCLSALACGPSFKTSTEEVRMKAYPTAPGAAAVVLERSGKVVLDYDNEIDDAATFKAFGKMGSSAGSGKSGAASDRPATGNPASPVDSMKRDSGSLVKRFGASSYTMEVKARIKILDQAGLVQAQVKDILPVGSRLESFAAATFLPGGQKLVLKQAQVQTQEGSISFEMPGARVGAVLEYSYKFYSPRMDTLTGWTFQSDIPVAHSKFRFKMINGTNLPFRFVKTTDDQQTEPEAKGVLGMDQKQWVELSWEAKALPASQKDGLKAAVLFGD